MSRKAKFTDAGEGLILKYILDCRVALAPRNDARFVVSLTNLIHLPPSPDSKFVVSPTSPNIYPRNDAKIIESRI